MCPMENDQHIRQVKLSDLETSIEIKRHPSMGFIFLKALLVSPFRSNTISDHTVVNKTRIVLNNFLADKMLITKYRTVCGFSQTKAGFIPISYLQTLFIGLLGKFITSPFFPINPLGLIQTFQSFEQKRPVAIHEILDLSCTLSGIKKTEKGLETSFILGVMSDGKVVWQGVSTFFTKSPLYHQVKKNNASRKKEDIFLKKRESIFVPTGTGRQYASVSGDYNPHHLYTLSAKLFGFDKAIAHGMWSLARVVASLDKEFGLNGAAMVEASFKLPIFMPATTALGYEYPADETGSPYKKNQTDQENDNRIVNFELRDEQKGLPHLKGRLLYTN